MTTAVDKDASTPVRDDSSSSFSNDAASTNAVASAENVAEEPSLERAPSGPPYSVFTTNQKRMIVITGSVASLFSPLSSQMYFPALNTIAADLGVSVSQVSLTVTTYLILQGIAPAFIANLSDTMGRRPAYMICFTIYLSANLGLGLQNAYAALAALRCVQSAGSSGTVALANGLVGDTITSAERGSYIAYASLASYIGPSLSPILGGVISQYAGWHWIFWFLLIFGGVFSLPLMLFLPETCRAVVGDGSGEKPWWNWNLLDLLRERRRKLSDGKPADPESGSQPGDNQLATTISRGSIPRKKVSFGNPLETLTVASDPATFVFLLTIAFGCFAFYAISTAAAAQFRSGYGFNDVQISLMFIPIGVGGIISGLTIGKVIDWNYARHARRAGLPLVKNKQVDISEFPIEKVRLEVALPLYIGSVVSVIAYGWVMQYTPHIAVPVIVIFFVGAFLTAMFQVFGILLVVLHPKSPATVSAANNLARCELGAVASAVVIPAIEGIGSGLTFTIFAAVVAAWGVLAWWVGSKGIEIRRKRREKEERKAAAGHESKNKMRSWIQRVRGSKTEA